MMDSCANSSSDTVRRLNDLQTVIRTIEECTVAVSGGIDSMVLSIVAGRIDDVRAKMFHAMSPAVPESATRRVLRYSKKENWQLKVQDVGEFFDARYVSNPVNRCFYCKTNLYQYIASESKIQIVSGTNQDDLHDFRPGLDAAKTFKVRHPYVEAGIGKQDIRGIARLLKLDDLAELPASPCLSSRVETGIPVDAQWLQAVDRAEVGIRKRLSAETVRCRIRKEGIVIELDNETLANIDQAARTDLQDMVLSEFAAIERNITVRFMAYRMGSAFVGDLP